MKRKGLRKREFTSLLINVPFVSTEMMCVSLVTRSVMIFFHLFTTMLIMCKENISGVSVSQFVFRGEKTLQMLRCCFF